MRTVVLLVVIVALSSGVVGADNGLLLPDASIVAQPMNGVNTVPGTSWRFAEVSGYRIWVDLFRPLESWGVGVSTDVIPAAPSCLGVGYIDSFTVYAGAHMTF